MRLTVLFLLSSFYTVQAQLTSIIGQVPSNAASIISSLMPSPTTSIASAQTSSPLKQIASSPAGAALSAAIIANYANITRLLHQAVNGTILAPPIQSLNFTGNGSITVGNETFGPTTSSSAYNGTLLDYISYHVIPNVALNLTANGTAILGPSTNSTSNATSQYAADESSYGGAVQAQNNTSVAVSFGNTTLAVLYTALNATQLVQLPGNGSQVLIFNSTASGNATLVDGNVTAPVQLKPLGNATQGPTLVGLDRPLVIPLPLNETLANVPELSQFASLLQQQPEIFANLSQPGLTLFAPNDAALAQARNSFTNQTDLLGLLLNHTVLDNATVWYSPLLVQNGSANANSSSNGNFTVQLHSVGGAMLNVTMDPTTGTFSVNNVSIVRSDVLISNGVIHVIGGVLNVNSEAGNATSSTAGAGAATTSESASSTSAMSETATPTSAATTTPAIAPAAAAWVDDEEDESYVPPIRYRPRRSSWTDNVRIL